MGGSRRGGAGNGERAGGRAWHAGRQAVLLCLHAPLSPSPSRDAVSAGPTMEVQTLCTFPFAPGLGPPARLFVETEATVSDSLFGRAPAVAAGPVAQHVCPEEQRLTGDPCP